MEKDTECKWKGHNGWDRGTYIRQNRLISQGYSRKKRKIMHNDKGDNQTIGITLVNIYAPYM